MFQVERSEGWVGEERVAADGGQLVKVPDGDDLDGAKGSGVVVRGVEDVADCLGEELDVFRGPLADFLEDDARGLFQGLWCTDALEFVLGVSVAVWAV